MLPDESGSVPRIANDKNSLGVVTVGDRRDVTVNDEKVAPNSNEGMSVSPSPSTLPVHRIPKMHEGRYPDARGSNRLICWIHRDSRFVEGEFAPGLSLRMADDGPNHGLIGPKEEVLLTVFVMALARTQADWIAVPWDGETK